MITLLHMLTWFSHVLDLHGAHHVAVSGVSHYLGWLETKHWIIKICFRGIRGCHL